MSFSTSQLGYRYSSSPEDPGVTWVAGELRPRPRELGRQVTGGAVRLAIALDEATDRWKDMIKDNHVTEASQSRRDTADSIRKSTQTLREQLDSIMKTMAEMAKQEQEEEEKKRKAEEEQREKERRRKATVEQQRREAQGQRSYSHTMVTVAVFLVAVAVCMHSGAHLTSGIIDISDSAGQPSIAGHEDSYSDFSSETIFQPSNSKNEDCEKILQDSPPCFNVGLFNSHSINNKQSRISNLINKFKLKVLTLTETWVSPQNGDQRLGEISPEFQFYHQPRVDKEGNPKRGGGVAIGFSKELQGERVQFENTFFESFEYVAADLRHHECDQPIRIITVYRPPRKNDQDIDKFLEEFQNLLNMCPKDKSILITGDFNIWVNVNSAMENAQQYKFATKFEELLKKNNLRQYVEKETHKNHNTLDLVIARNVDIPNLCVKKPKNQTETKTNKETNEVTQKNKTISDHSAVIFNVCC